MEPTILETLRTLHTEGPGFTHYTYYTPQQRWNLRDEHKAQFWSAYCRAVYENSRLGFSLAEKLTESVPIIADFIFSFDAPPPEGTDYCPYNFILSIIQCYQQAISELLIISDEGRELICCFLETESVWREGELYNFGFRFQFPFCRTSLDIQTRQLRPLVIKLLRQKNVISRLTQQPVRDWDRIIDPTTVSEPITLYGSTKNSFQPKFLYQEAIRYVEDDDLQAGMTQKVDLNSIFNPRYHSLYQQQILTDAMFEGIDDPEYWLPLFLSLGYSTGVTLPQKSPESPARSTTTRTTTAISVRENYIDIADELLQCLNRERVENDTYWLEIGKILFTLHNGEETGLQRWISFTERSDNHTDDECRNLYSSFQDNNLTVKTLAWYAREDSPDRYNNWNQAWAQEAMKKALSCLHTDVANAFFRFYWLEYVCIGVKSECWFKFVGHRWVPLNAGVDVRQTMSSDFLHRFELYHTEVSSRRAQTDDQSLKEQMGIELKKIDKLIDKLKTVTFKNQIFRESMEFFFDDKFESRLNSNPLLMGVGNGIIEIINDRRLKDVSNIILFRNGKPEDYVSKNAGPYLNMNLTWGHPLVVKLMTWMRQTFPDKDLLHHFLKLSASILRGRNVDKLFQIWAGANGNNSKSMMVKLFEYTFGRGQYIIKFPTSLLTQKRGASGNACPEIARSEATRAAILQEPDDDERIVGGILKELTGGDSMFTRTLHDKGKDMETFFKLIMMCNKIPRMMTGGTAVKNRVLIIPFLSTWTHDAPEDPEEQMRTRTFKMDPTFEYQIPDMAPAFLWVLVQYYPKYILEGVSRIPEIVKEYTDQYWEDNDIYHQYISENIEEAKLPDGTRDVNARLIMSEIYKSFQSWYRDMFPSSTIPDQNIVKDELVRRFGRQQNRAWYGIRMVNNLANI